MNKSESLLKRLIKVCSLLLIALVVSSIFEAVMHNLRSVKIVYLPDPQTIPLAHLDQLDSLDPKVLNKGKAEMSKHKVIIAGITRDNAVDLPVMMKHIESLGDTFADYRVILFENDSSDGTQGILRAWELGNDKVHIISKNYNNYKRASVNFLANARNHYIEAIKDDPQYADFDMLMVVDMDMKYGIDLRGVEDSFAQINKWDAVCSNGIYNGEGRMFDMFAFREVGSPWRPKDDEADLYLHGKIRVPGERPIHPAGTELVPVDSCFGGLAFYKMNAIKGCKYGSGAGYTYPDDCEHIAFYDCLRTHNGGKIFLNPSQMLKYSHFTE